MEDILDELTVENPAKVIAERQKRFEWWKMEDEFYLYEMHGDELILPRGYALRLKQILREHEHQVKWIDRRKGVRGYPFKWRKEFCPRPHQPLAVKKMRRHQQGIYQAPTGSGKSLTGIKFIHDVHPQRTIILVDKIDLLNQWIKNIEEWLYTVPGRIGGGKWETGERIVVATVQSIWSRMKAGTLPDDFFELFDCVIVDECHHTSAETIRNIVSRFIAKWRIGKSATPDRLDDKFEITEAVLGPVFHEDDEEKLIELGVILRPVCHVIKTDFDFEYWPDHESDDDGACQKPGCKIWRKHSHKNNYQKLKDALVSDKARNSQVAETIAGESLHKHHHIVISDEIRHLKAIEQEIIYTLLGLPIYTLTGKITGKNRKELIEQIEGEEACVILATVAKEGMDIPAIDRVYLPFPSSNPKITKQKVGRGTRVATGKGDVKIFDFVDFNLDVLKKQFRKRRYGFYDKSGIEVIK